MRQRRTRRAWMLLLSILSSFVFSSQVSIQQASATTYNCISPHCYTLADFSIDWAHGDYVMGDYLKLEATCLAQSDPVNYFVTDETWVGTDASGVTYWIEAGMARGYPQSGSYLFWADNRPGGGYHEHDDSDGSATTNTYYLTDIEGDSYPGGATWYVYVGGYSGYSTNNPTPSIELQAGTENYGPTSTYGAVEQTASPLYFFGGNKVMYYTWAYSRGVAEPVQNPSGYGNVSINSNHSAVTDGTGC